MKKYVPIELDKVRNLKYGMNALVKIEETLNKPITSLNTDSISMKELLIILWVGLIHEDKELTPEKVGDLIDEYGDINSLSEKLKEAFSLAFGKNVKSPAMK